MAHILYMKSLFAKTVNSIHESKIMFFYYVIMFLLSFVVLVSCVFLPSQKTITADLLRLIAMHNEKEHDF